MIAAGISPGSNNIFGDVDGSDVPGEGISRIGTVVLGSLGSPTDDDGDPSYELDEDQAPWGVFADTSIDALIIDGVLMPKVVIIGGSNFRSWTVRAIAPDDIGGFEFDATLPFNGLLVDEHDVGGMAECMLRIIETPGLSRTLGSAGKKNISQNFTMEKHLKTIADSLLSQVHRVPPYCAGTTIT